MAVHIETTLSNMFNDAGETIVSMFVAQAKANAPVGTTGQLAGNITGIRDGMWHWTVSTHAYGPSYGRYSGFEYPARIEEGQEVHPRPGNERGLYYNGTWHAKSRASDKSGFMKKTISQFRI